MIDFNFSRTLPLDQTESGFADEIGDEAAFLYTAALNNDDSNYIDHLVRIAFLCEKAIHKFDQATINSAAANLINTVNQSQTDQEPLNETDDVTHPSHYPEGSFANIETIIDGLPAAKAVCLANVLKYAIRAGHKDDKAKDLAKAHNYAHRLVTGKWIWE